MPIVCDVIQKPATEGKTASKPWTTQAKFRLLAEEALAKIGCATIDSTVNNGIHYYFLAHRPLFCGLRSSTVLAI